LSKADGLIKLHWQGKHRGPDFEPVMFKLDCVTAPSLVDKRGRFVPTVLARDMSRGEVVAAAASARRDEDDVLLQLEVNPSASLSGMAEGIGWVAEDGSAHKDRARRAADKLKGQKLIVNEGRKWKITAAGYDALTTVKAERHRLSQVAEFTARQSAKIVRTPSYSPHEVDDD